MYCMVLPHLLLLLDIAKNVYDHGGLEAVVVSVQKICERFGSMKMNQIVHESQLPIA